MKEIKIEEIDFEKMGGMIPTIVQEKDGTVLSLIYSSRESLAQTIQTGFVWKQSRERGRIAKKGESSGNVQKVIKIRTDCDNDALLFTVEQLGEGIACAKGKYICFGVEKKLSLGGLYEKISSRKENAPADSYTKKLFTNPPLLKRKLVEGAA